MFIRSFFYEKYPYKHLCAQRKGFGRLSFFALSDESRPNVYHFVIADVGPPQIRK